MRQAIIFITLGFLLFTTERVHAQEKILLPDVEVVADSISKAPQYSGVVKRTIDVLHMDLEIQLDWPSHSLLGQANLYLKPIFDPIDTVVLDAKGFDVKQIALVEGGAQTPLNYRNDGLQLHIGLGRQAVKDEILHLYIDYQATPDSLQETGGAAITSNKGFYFIDSTEVHPQSFWTQGEPESNSAWFPTQDKPFEKFTHKIGITVNTAWQTLSNGTLAFRTINGDGTKTDYWLMDLPQAPYLTMVAGGPFDTVSSQWNGKPMNYFVEKAWKDEASGIFAATSDMISFFGDLFKMPYPWPSLNQIVVRNYVSGAMENTTAIVYGEAQYKDERARADNTTENIIAHEIVHQWFGDLVTPRNWGNVALNEGFASYGEVLWREHKYGKEDMDWYMKQEMDGYLREYNRGKVEPIVRTYWETPDDMFDAHSYNKAGRVLHMLRVYLGDEAFFNSIANYLKKNEYQVVEMDDLRMAMEETSGQDLRWFFDQWFFKPGHPKLKVTNGFNKANSVATVKVEQLQDAQEFGIYRLPVTIAVYTHLGVKEYKVEIEKQVQFFEFPVHSQPFLVKFDAQNHLLAEVEIEQSDAMWLHQLGNSKVGLDRYYAAQHMMESTNYKLVQTVSRIAMADAFWPSRLLGMENAEKWGDGAKSKFKGTIKDLIEDTVPAVRARALTIWSSVYGEKDEKRFIKNLDFISYNVNKAALEALGRSNPKLATQKALEYIPMRDKGFSRSSAKMVVMYGQENDIRTAYKLVHQKTTSDELVFLVYLSKYLNRGGDEAKEMVDIMAETAKNSGNNTLKYYAYKLLEQGQEELAESALTAEGDQAKNWKETSAYAQKKLSGLTAP